MYNKLIKRLRHPWEDNGLISELTNSAADVIEQLSEFAHFVAKEIMIDEDLWDLNYMAFPELACRRLHKIGIVEKNGAFWHYEPKEE